MSCYDKTKSKDENVETIESGSIEIEDNNFEFNKNDSESFPEINKLTIVKFDDQSNRYFVVIDSSLVYDYETITQIICEVESKLSIDSKTKISFFNQAKWADYKNILFFKNTSEHSEKKYQNWLNNYYQGEFNFETRLYETFPASEPNLNKRKNLKIKNCA